MRISNKCSNPIDAAVLSDYWTAALAKPEAETVEEHLFTCDQCGTRLREVIALAEGVRELKKGTANRKLSETYAVHYNGELNLHNVQRLMNCWTAVRIREG